MTRAFFAWDHLRLRYEPYPIGLARPVCEPGLYRELVDAFPTVERFAPLRRQTGYVHSLAARILEHECPCLPSVLPAERAEAGSRVGVEGAVA